MALYQNIIFKITTPALVVLVAAAAIVGLNLLFHLLFGTPYLLERTALMLYPVLLSGLFLFLQEALSFWFRMFTGIALLLLGIFLAINIYKSFSLPIFKELPVQGRTWESLEYLKQVGAKSAGLHHWHNNVFVNYYTVAYPGRYSFSVSVVNGSTLLQTNVVAKAPGTSYLVLAPPDTAQKLLPAGWKIKRYFKDAGTIIMQRN